VAKKVLPQFKKIHSASKKVSVFEMKNGEKFKTLNTCNAFWNFLTDKNADRNALVINIGGGVVSDLGGFCASVYKRGIDFVNVPTTVLSAADASVGGKTGIDFMNFKNHIGSFTQPKGVYIFPPFLENLEYRHKINGIAEIIKAAIIWDNNFFKTIINVERNEELWEEKILKHSVSIKNKIVLKDPKENNIRKILNYGHSIGHAIESYYLNKKGKMLLHGEAIAIGMITEAYISNKKKLISFHELISITLLLSRWFSLINIPTKDIPPIIDLIYQDKKNNGNILFMALPDRIGHCIPQISVNEKEIKEAFYFYNSL
jgi:3-dehydroquinate synthase